MVDPYAILGTEPSASIDQVRHAYRARTKLFHPDAGGSHENFIALTSAYEQILDNIKNGRSCEPHHPPPAQAAEPATSPSPPYPAARRSSNLRRQSSKTEDSNRYAWKDRLSLREISIQIYENYVKNMADNQRRYRRSRQAREAKYFQVMQELINDVRRTNLFLAFRWRCELARSRASHAIHRLFDDARFLCKYCLWALHLRCLQLTLFSSSSR
jgi:curved DNA-binding protein CbpA